MISDAEIDRDIATAIIKVGSLPLSIQSVASKNSQIDDMWPLFSPKIKRLAEILWRAEIQMAEDINGTALTPEAISRYIRNSKVRICMLIANGVELA